MVGHYDSPTFLNQQDKLLFGLTVMQIILLVGVGFLLFMLTFMLPIGSTVVRMAVLVPMLGVAGVVMFARFAGLSLPSFIVLWILGMFRRPCYEDESQVMLQGDPAWLEASEDEGGRRRFGRFRRGRMTEHPDLEVRKAEAKAEVDRALTEGASSAQQWVQDGVRSVMRGR